jgi:hypothetical protein
MNSKLKITGLILAGYALGRTKKLGLALTVASTLAGSTAVRNRDQLMGGLKDFAESSPELKSLQEKITGRLADSGKNAAKAMAAKGVDQLSNTLQDQTEKMKSTLDDTAEDLDPSSEEPEDETVESERVEAEVDEPEDSGESEDEEPEEEAPKKPARKRSSRSSNTTGAKKRSSTSSRSSSARKGSAAKKTSNSRKTKGADDE